MSARSTLRALPTLLRVGFSDAIAYRAEMFVWILATTMPLIMLALFSAVAEKEPIGRYGQSALLAYFLVTFIVRQLTGSWASWQMNFEVRQGTLAMRLLRPIHPFVSYATENIAAIPLRLVVAVPIALVVLATSAAGALTRDPLLWVLGVTAVVGGWMITLFANFAIGSLSFYMESSVKVMDVWLAAFFVFSGYLIPIDLFPQSVRDVADWLPFRYQIGLSVELLTGAHERSAALFYVVRQWAYVAFLLALSVLLWRRGLARFAAYGG